MALYSDITDEVDRSPDGPGVAAFFDVDRTLLAGFSAIEFWRDGVTSGRMTPSAFGEALLAAARFQLGHVGFSNFVSGSSVSLRGVAESDFQEIGERIFVDRLASEIYPESRALVRAHLRKGHTVAIVSSATRYQIDPLARELEIPHVLCTRLETRDGRFTGRALRPTCYAEGKADAARTFSRASKIDLSRSWFYSDSDEDLPLFEIVGRPRPLNPSSALARIAGHRGWPTRRFRSRGTPGATEMVRTALAVASLVPSLLLAAPAAVLDRSWRRLVNVGVSTWGEVGTALAGIELEVTGEEHLWSHRPAVFIFNHQSSIDMLLLARLLRRDFVGVAKREVLQNPFWGPAMALAGTVFIDRSNRARAIEALAPAVDALRQGLSIVIAPEGTRSATPRLGRFKKGAFHMAMAAGAPIVPIVFRNALDAMPKHALFVRPATIEARVLPPVSTKGWTAKTLDREIDAIRKRYEEALANDR